MQRSYNDYAKYYDLIFQQKDYDKEVEFIKSIIQKNSISKDSILDVGCGTGTHLYLLKDEFKTLYGVDVSKKILDIARKKIPDANFQEGNMQDFKIHNKFDVITCLYSVFNYNLDKKSAIKTLKNFYKHLKSHGILIIALYNEKNTEKQTSLHIGEDEETKVAKINEFKYYPEEKILISNHFLIVKDKGKVDFDIEVEDKFRIFDFEEIEEIVKKSGFKEYLTYDNFTFKEAKEDETKYPILVLEKGD
jgi:SAM-dependent methyltransferase